MTRAARAASLGSYPRLWVGLGAILTGSCLLTTSLDGLEGPPLSPDAGAPEGGAADAREDESESAADAGAGDVFSDDGGHADDPVILDGGGDGDGDGATKGPIRVADAGGTLRGIAEHDTDIYWVQSDTNAGIVRAPKGGGQAPVFFDATADAFDVAVDADYVYWSTGKGNEVFRAPIGSTAPSGKVLFPGANETFYLAVGTSGRVYVTGANAVTLGPRIDAGIGDAIYPFQGGAAGVAVSGTDLFWSLDAGIVRGNDTGQSQPRPVYPGAPGEVGGIAADGQEIYWIASDGAVRALSLTNPGPISPREVCRATVAIGDADARPDSAGNASMADIAVDDQWVYFTEPAIGQISKCLKR